MTISIPPDEFDRLVDEALERLPRRFAELLDNIVVVVEEEPTEDDFDAVDDDDDDHELLGIYRVIPPLPDQIAIFRGPILRIARSRREAIHEIGHTVIHELGHYFGLEDGEMVF